MAIAALCLLLLCLSGNMADLLSSSFDEASDYKRANCEQYKLPGCPRDYNPVCGSDMTTYANECLLCTAIRETGHKIKITRSGPC
ncbi:serine protease inhibitor Kazal-type 2 [Suncus etruscus]|uniref:serine protease inhibitor Kazal-type 2 n=1 Tax=Suncus etruscus TaxID=109475 RepID=UPI0021105AF6|nr:serine protease inhibitor Kazal-type 2 [Suncus etruscus]